MAVFKLFSWVLVLLALAVGAKMVEPHVHHIVTGATGWDWEPSFELGSNFIFKVGDHIWFRNATTQDGIVELQTHKEYLSCDVSNPIKMYTDSQDKIPLEAQGIRYFTSGNPRQCRNGMKLHMTVHPLDMPVHPLEKNETASYGSATVKAAGPTPSASTQLTGFSYLLFVGLLIYFVGLAC